MDLVVLIPAYKPAEPLVKLVRELANGSLRAIVVVNDGSGREYDEVFKAVREVPKVALLNHAVNLGKGAALKTGLNHCLFEYGQDMAVVTADADGQHLAPDILAVGRRAMEDRNTLIMGARQFDGEIPLRSKFGNWLTRHVMWAVSGFKLTDTQTGLRAICPTLIPKLLKVPSRGYEFELDMLIICRQSGVAIREQPISTVYLDGNKSSHFNPLLDSIRIYFVLLRFAIASVMTAAIDYAVFTIVYLKTGHVAASQIAARFVALLFNYIAVKRAVFHSDRKHAEVFPKYVLVVILSGIASYGLISLFTRVFTMGVIWAKLLAEALIFSANFAVLREFIFSRRNITERSEQ